MTVININAIQANTGTPDVNGAKWYVTEMEGWDSPTVRMQSVDVPTVELAVPTEGLYGSRNIIVRGLCKTTSESAFYTSWNRLQTQTNFLGRTTFVFSVAEDITRRCNVVRNGQLIMENIGIGSFTFELLMRADDPFKYNDTLSTQFIAAYDSEVLVNNGTARTYPIITLDSDDDPPEIARSPQRWTAEATIPIGTVIDMRKQTVGDYFSDVAPNSEWIFLEPGNNDVGGTVDMTVSWRGAWV